MTICCTENIYCYNCLLLFSYRPCPVYLHQVVACLEEVEDEGLLISWSLSKQPSFSLTVSPCKLQRRVGTLTANGTNLMSLLSVTVTFFKLKACVCY